MCPFNSCHHIPLAEEQYHRARCEDRKLVEMTRYQMRGEAQKPVSFTPARREAQDDEEDWELEATITTSYDPSKKTSQLPVLRKLAGATPSQRKEFRAMEKVRLEELGSGGGGSVTGLRRPQVGVGVGTLSNDGRVEGGNSGVLGTVGGRGRLITVGRGGGKLCKEGLSDAGPVGVVGGRAGEVGTKLGKGRGRIVWGL